MNRCNSNHTLICRLPFIKEYSHRMPLKGMVMFFALLPCMLHAQEDSASFFAVSGTLNPKRLSIVIGTEAVAYTGSMIALNSLWYAAYARTSFHFFNDNDQWQQMDKMGHFTTAFQIGRVGMQVLQWSGVEEKKSIWYGGGLGLFFLTSVEVMDGFSSRWGASVGDIMANLSGTAMLISQQYAWKENRVSMKFSVHPSPYASYRREMFGNTFSEHILKDYNGQTYWLCVHVRDFLKSSSRFPAFLNIALGYSGNEMLHGDRSAYILIDKQGGVMTFDPYRQLFLSIDIDLSKLIVKPGFCRTLLGAFGWIKIPAPALEYNTRDGFRFRPFYF